MTRYIIRRLLHFIPTLIAVSLIAFFLVRTTVDPLAVYLQDPGLSSADVERLRAFHGLDRPLYVQYGYWLRDILQGNWGYSLHVRRPVTELIMSRLPNTLILMGSTLFLTLAISIPLGIYSAVNRYSFGDYVLTGFAFAAYSTPSFWLGILLIMLFSVQFKEWGLPSLPAGGMYDLITGKTVGSVLKHLILPTIVLSIVGLTRYTRYLRASMVEVLQMDYIRTARAKGLSEGVIQRKHAFKNACLPLVTLVSLDLPRLFSGALITEQVFAWPGIGRLFVTHAFYGDYPVLMGLVIMVSLLVVVASLAADIVYAALDPTIRYDT